MNAGSPERIVAALGANAGAEPDDAALAAAAIQSEGARRRLRASLQALGVGLV